MSRSYSEASDDSVPTASDVAGWVARTGLDHDDLLDELGLAVARAFDDGELSFEVCDRVINDLYAYLSSLEHWPAVFWDVYEAFDQGEFFHDDKRSDDPAETYTRPLIRAVLGRAAPPTDPDPPSSGAPPVADERAFDNSRLPPVGWMHALFEGGPHGEELGHCVTGPPPPDTWLVDGVTYHLTFVGTWGKPATPVAIYGSTRNERG